MMNRVDATEFGCGTCQLANFGGLSGTATEKLGEFQKLAICMERWRVKDIF
jgi:hypothetical protein